MTTTWEWMHGAVVANSMLGFGYVAECSWSLGKTSVKDFERRFGRRWLGLREGDVGGAVHSVLAAPWPAQGPAAVMRNGRLMEDLFWKDPRSVCRQLALRHEALRTGASEIAKAADDALSRLAALRKDARSNADLLPYAEMAFRMYRFCGEKLLATEKAAQLYAAAGKPLGKGDPAAVAEPVEQAAKEIEGLIPMLDTCIQLYRPAVAALGAYEKDVPRMEDQQKGVAALVAQLRDLALLCRSGKAAQLPAAEDLGLGTGQAVRLGTWGPKQMSENDFEIRLDATGKVAKAGALEVEWSYVRGGFGVKILRTSLLADGREVAADEHEGWTGAGSRKNVYHLNLESFQPKARYEIVGKLRCPGGTESFGEIWLFSEE
jgi:hypothetical protein